MFMNLISVRAVKMRKNQICSSMHKVHIVVEMRDETWGVGTVSALSAGAYTFQLCA
jgi:hypothetical protein